MQFRSPSALVLGIALAAASCTPQPTTLDRTGSAGGSSAGGTVACAPPAEVSTVIGACASCHGQAGSLPKLVTPADFEARSPNGGTFGQRSVARMKSAGSPMPPDGLLAAAEVSAFEAWVNGGYDLTCPTTSSASSGGATSGGGTTSGGTTSGGSTPGSTSSRGTVSGGGAGAVAP